MIFITKDRKEMIRVKKGFIRIHILHMNIGSKNIDTFETIYP